MPVFLVLFFNIFFVVVIDSAPFGLLFSHLISVASHIKICFGFDNKLILVAFIHDEQSRAEQSQAANHIKMFMRLGEKDR